jgi:TM2 domain-containing membrane protein YozV
MNCANHADVPATAYCRTCGKPVCSSCARDVRGVIYCEECLASHVSGTVPPPGPAAVPPGAQPATGVPSPGLAAILGFIPGVGAMYNGEYAKGFIHVVIFATLIWMADNVSGLFGIAIAAFVIYMPIEAYKTARAKEMGLPPPDPFGLNNLFSPGGSAKPAAGVAASVVPAGGNPAASPEGQPADAECGPPSRVPVGAFILIGLGVLFLLDEIGVLHMHNLWRFWPLVLIAIGARILMRRSGRGW